MTKGIKIFLIVLLSVLVVGLLGIMIYFMSGGNFGIKTSNKLVFEKKYESNKEIYIDADASKIEINTSDVDEIKVLVYSDDDMKNDIKSSDTNIKINSKKVKKRFISINQKLAKIEIYIPTNYDKLINIDTRVGDIDIDSILTGKVKIKSDVGDIDIKEVNDLEIDANVGDVEIDKVKSADIDIDVGDLEIDTISEYMDISLNCGDLEIDKVNLIKDSKIELDLGDVEINNISNIYIDAKTDLGDVKINNNYKNADITLTIENDTGDIDIMN